MAHFKGVKDRRRIKAIAKVRQDEGRVLNVPFVCIFKVPNYDQSQQLVEDAQEGLTKEEEVYREYLLGWDKLLDQNDEPIEFSPESFTEALSIPEYREAIKNAFLELLFGKEKQRRKN